MNLSAVMAELATALDTIEGLRVHGYQAKKIVPPAAIVELPEVVDFDATYGRGSDSMTMTVHLMVGQVSDRESTAAIAAYADGSGAKSVKTVLEAASYTACDDVTVDKVEFGSITVAAVEYLAARFTVSITGAGS